jgi:hypothetical protein
VRVLWAISLLGYLILATGLLGGAIYYYTRFRYLLPQDMGIVLGNGALVLLGCVTTAVATVLRKLERRLDQIDHPKQHQFN